MNKNKILTTINYIFYILFLLLGIWYIYRVYENRTWEKITVKSVLIVLGAATVINLLKGLRLYIILFGREFEKKEYAVKYMQTAIINMIIPLRLGEVYRGFSFGDGKLIKSYMDSYIIILFDRFVDTLALISILMVMCFLSDIQITITCGILTIFLLGLLVSYLSFPSLYVYWNHTLILKRSSKNTLAALLFLEKIRLAIKQLSKVVSGRFFLLYVLSLIAWIVEIAVTITFGYNLETRSLNEYLIGIFRGGTSTFNHLYLVASAIIYGCFLIILRVKYNEDNNSI